MGGEGEAQETDGDPEDPVHRHHGTDGFPLAGENRFLPESSRNRRACGGGVGAFVVTEIGQEGGESGYPDIRVLPFHELPEEAGDADRVLARDKAHGDFRLGTVGDDGLSTRAGVSTGDPVDLEGGQYGEGLHHVEVAGEIRRIESSPRSRANPFAVKPVTARDFSSSPFRGFPHPS